MTSKLKAMLNFSRVLKFSTQSTYNLFKTHQVLPLGRSLHVCLYSSSIFGQYPHYSTETSQSHDLTLNVISNLATIDVPLPSRRETCQFTLKPVSHTIADFVNFLKLEDQGIDRVAFYNNDGIRIAQSTRIEILLKFENTLQINDTTYKVIPPTLDVSLTNGESENLNAVKCLISELFSKMNIEEYQKQRELDLVERAEQLSLELEPLEKSLKHIATKAEQRSTVLKWVGLGLMGTQFGVLARLTWWEYSWDIMEPVTYFVTYGTAIVMYAYFVCTKQDYEYPGVFSRQTLLNMHKNASAEKFDIHQFNRLKEEQAQVEFDLKRLRDPMYLHLPVEKLYKQPPDSPVA